MSYSLNTDLGFSIHYRSSSDRNSKEKEEDEIANTDGSQILFAAQNLHCHPNPNIFTTVLT